MKSIRQFIFSTLITLVFVFLFLFSAYVLGYFAGKVTIKCNTAERLCELFSCSFDAADIGRIHLLIDEKDDSTLVCVFLEDESLCIDENYNANELQILCSNYDKLPTGIIVDLEVFDVHYENILSFVRKYGQIRVGYSVAPYEIYTIRLRDATYTPSNTVVVAWIPRRIDIGGELDQFIQ